MEDGYAEPGTQMSVGSQTYMAMLHRLTTLQQLEECSDKSAGHPLVNTRHSAEAETQEIVRNHKLMEMLKSRTKP